jgi:hypothetical protein
MPWAITKPRSAWLAQAREAWAALAPQAPQGVQLRALAAIDHETFARLIEALCALTPGHVSQELQDLAGLRPVGEVLGMPDRGDADDDAADVDDW